MHAICYFKNTLYMSEGYEWLFSIYWLGGKSMAGQVSAVGSVSSSNGNSSAKSLGFGTPSLTMPNNININNIWDKSAQCVKNAAKGVSLFNPQAQTSTAFQA